MNARDQTWCCAHTEHEEWTTRRVTAQSIGGYDGRRARCALLSVQWHCGEPWSSHSPCLWSNALGSPMKSIGLLGRQFMIKFWIKDGSACMPELTVQWLIVTMTGIHQVTSKRICFYSSSWLIVMHYHHCDRIFCGQLLVVSMLLILNMSQTAWIGRV